MTKYMVKVEFLKKLMITNGINENDIEGIPYWIDIEGIRQKVRAKPPIELKKGSKKIFMFCGRLHHTKGPDLALKAFTLLSKEFNNVALVFIGDGNLQNDLRRFCIVNCIQDKVTFLGRIPYDFVHQYFGLADYFLFTSPYSNYHWALLEAMCTMRPVVATDVGDTRDILIDKFNALLCRYDPKLLMEKMKELNENTELAEKIAKNAFLTIKERHSLNNLEKYERMIRSLAEY